MQQYSKWIALAVLFVLGIQGCRSDHKTSTPPASASPSSAPASAVPASSPAASAQKALPEDWQVAEEFDFDWQGNGVPAHFKIEQSPAEQISRLTINIKGQPDFVLNNNEGWDEFAHNLLKGEDFLRRNKNLAVSKYVVALAPSRSARPLVFLTAQQYASDPEDFFVLALDSSGRPKVIFKNNLHILEFQDLDGDGVAEIAGQPCFSQGWGNDLLTYDPLHVYKLQSTPEPELKLSLPLSEQYSLKHYYGWAGPDCSEELAVVLHPPGGGKPVIVKADDAKKMFEKKK